MVNIQSGAIFSNNQRCLLRWIIIQTNFRNYQNRQNLMHRLDQKKKKNTSTTNSFFKLPDKLDKSGIKFQLNMFFPRPSCGFFNSKPQILKSSKSGTNTPQVKITKKSLKQNGYSTALNSIVQSPTSTPFNCDLAEQKQKNRQNYNFLYQIGSGGFGKVWKVQQKRSNCILAMKEISKAKVLLKKSVGSVINQKIILEQISSPFLINMKGSFQDREYLYMIMEYLRGGDLRYHLCYYDNFSEYQTKFLAGCIILGLEFIHSKNIIHRDLKPQNLVFEENGYLKITDFGVARKYKQNNSQQTSGTPGYMAPEVICRMNHSYEADFFALGVILYEIILGVRPYLGDTRKEIRDKILIHQAKISQNELPLGWSYQSMDFVNKLLKRNKESRLGYRGIEQLKQHSWFEDLSWRKLARKQITPPYIPGVITQSRDYQKQMESTNQTINNDEAQVLLRNFQIQNLFKDYDEKRAKKYR